MEKSVKEEKTKNDRKYIKEKLIKEDIKSIINRSLNPKNWVLKWRI